MGYRTDPDRILESIDRERDREAERLSPAAVRQATGRELDTGVPEPGAAPGERLARLFRAIERSYIRAAQSVELRRMAARFQTIGDIHHHHARGDVTVVVEYLDSSRDDDVGMAPFEIRPERIEEIREETGSSRPDVNALKALREELRNGVLGAYRKLEPRLREAVREGADHGHVTVEVILDLRPAR